MMASSSRYAQNHISDFFGTYPDFDYNPSAPVMEEFYRMSDHFRWGRQSNEKEQARDRLKDALTQEFNDIYGTDINDMNAWRKLCGVLGINPVPEKLKQCREAVRATHVNLVDLVDSPSTGEPVTIFQSVQQLSVYTKESGKFFPMENAYAGGVLRYLLRKIMFPPAETSRGGGGRGRRGRGGRGRGRGRGRGT